MWSARPSSHDSNPSNYGAHNYGYGDLGLTAGAGSAAWGPPASAMSQGMGAPTQSANYDYSFDPTRYGGCRQPFSESDSFAGPRYAGLGRPSTYDDYMDDVPSGGGCNNDWCSAPQSKPRRAAKKASVSETRSGGGGNAWTEGLALARRDLGLEGQFTTPNRGTQLHRLATQYKNRIVASKPTAGAAPRAPVRQPLRNAPLPPPPLAYRGGAPYAHVVARPPRGAAGRSAPAPRRAAAAAAAATAALPAPPSPNRNHHRGFKLAPQPKPRRNAPVPPPFPRR